MMGKMLNYSLKVSKFERHLCYSVNFQIGKSMNSLIPLAMGYHCCS